MAPQQLVVAAPNGRSALPWLTAGAPTSPTRSRTSAWTRVTSRERLEPSACTSEALLRRAFDDWPCTPISNLILLAKAALLLERAGVESAETLPIPSLDPELYLGIGRPP